MYIPCHARPLPCTPPITHTPYHACPLCHTQPPAVPPPATHAPSATHPSLPHKPSEQNDWLTGVKTLPFRNYCCGWQQEDISVKYQPPAFRQSVIHSELVWTCLRGVGGWLGLWVGEVPVQWGPSWRSLNISAGGRLYRGESQDRGPLSLPHWTEWQTQLKTLPSSNFVGGR